MMTSNGVKLVVAQLLMAFAIVKYSQYRCVHPEYKDVLATYPIGGEQSALKEVLDGWSISHFVFYMVLGYNFPDTFTLAMTLGVTWEGLEYLTQHSSVGMLDRIRGLSVCKNDASANGEHWWYAKGSDLVMNLLGFMVGKHLGLMFRNGPLRK